MEQRLSTFLSSAHRLYVNPLGDDATHDGTSAARAFRTISAAVARARSLPQRLQPGGVVLLVEAGEYADEDTPVRVPANVAILGDNLRRTVLRPRPGRDFFHVENACYLYGLRFVGLRRPAFCVAFPCATARVQLWQGAAELFETLKREVPAAAAPLLVAGLRCTLLGPGTAARQRVVLGLPRAGRRRRLGRIRQGQAHGRAHAAPPADRGRGRVLPQPHAGLARGGARRSGLRHRVRGRRRVVPAGPARAVGRRCRRAAGLGHHPVYSEVQLKMRQHHSHACLTADASLYAYGRP